MHSAESAAQANWPHFGPVRVDGQVFFGLVRRQMIANPFKNSANDSKSLQKNRRMTAHPFKNSANDNTSLQKIGEWQQIPSKIWRITANPFKNLANDSKSLQKFANDSKSLQKFGE